MSTLSNSDTPSSLSETDFQQLQTQLSDDLRLELRRVHRQSLFSVGLQAIAQVVLAVILFKASRQYMDVTLWAVGVCLLVFSSLQFLEIEYISTGRSWMDIFEKRSS